MSSIPEDTDQLRIPRIKLAHPLSYDDEKDVATLTSTNEKLSSTVVQLSNSKSALTTNPVTYTWENITVDTNVVEGSYFQRNRKSYQKRILDNVTGAASPGEFVAIMGSSGAGKTTLLNCLTFRNNRGSLKITGERHLNGSPVSQNVLARISGYVQQDDLFIGAMKVVEVLQFQAMLRMDKHYKQDERMAKVEEVIQEMGLNKCRNTLIGMPDRGIKGISGGERKRLAFACEMLTNPSLMFCDEPTSGLDSFMAQNVVQALKNMASSGRTVICTIHQPSSEVFAMFDRILLMAEGKTAFLGRIDEALEFFTRLGMPCPANFNPADHFIFSLATVPGREAESHESIARICSEFHESEPGRKVASVVAKWHRPGDRETQSENENLKRNTSASPYKASWFQQFSTVFWRSFLSVWRDPAFLFIKGVGSIFLSLIVALFYQGQSLDVASAFNIQGVIFLAITNASFETVFTVVSTFSLELPIFLREHGNGMYRTDVYFLCKSFAELFVYIVYPFISFAIPYYIIGLNPDVDRFFIAAGIIILVTNTATSFGYFLSCLAPTPQLALTIAPPMVLPLLLLGGFFLQSGSTPVYLDWIKYLSWFMYANEAMSINQWHGVDFNLKICEVFGIIDSIVPPTSTSGPSFNFSSTVVPPHLSTFFSPDNSTLLPAHSTIVPPHSTIIPPDLNPIFSLITYLVNAVRDLRDSVICTGDDILDRFSFHPEYFTRDLLCLVALIIGFRLLAYLALLSKTFKK